MISTQRSTTRWWQKSLRGLAMLGVSFMLFPNAQAQFCSGTVTNSGTITPTGTVQTVVGASGTFTYWTFNTVAGGVYNFNTCGSGGDTYLRLYSTATGGTVLALDDDGCSPQSTFSYTETVASTRSVLLTNWSCSALSAATTMSYSATAPPPPCGGTTCAYTLRLTDSYGDGWNGATMQIRQGTSVVATVGGTFTTGTGPVDVSVPGLCNGTAYNLYWATGGSYPTEVGVQLIDPYGVTLFIKPANTGSAGTQLYSFSAACTPPACPPVAGLSASNTGATSANVSWTCASCTGSFIVEYGAPGFTPGTGLTAGAGGTIATTSGLSPYALTGLTGGSSYTVAVRQNCGGTFSTNQTTNFTTPPGCGSNFYDSGGPSGTYQNFESQTITICPTNPGDVVTVTFSLVSLESCCDYLNVYDANSVSGPATAILSGTTPTFTANNITGCLTFTFSSDVSLTPDGWAATVTCAPAPTCPTPTSTSASGVTTNSAVANWTNNGGSGTYIVEYGPTATFTTPGTDANPGAGGTVITNATSPQTIGGLAFGTQFRYFVRQDCSGGDFSANSAGQLFTTLFPPPANDLCEDAIALTCGVAVTGSTTAANNVGAPGITCGTSPSTAGGVWYTISGVCGSTTASMCTGTNYDSKLFVYTGTCGGFSCVDGNDDGCGAQSTVTWTADASTTYYLYVAGFSTNTGTYGLVVNCGGTPLAATAAITDDCLNGTYTVDVNISDLGSGSSADIVYVVNGGAPQTQPGAGLGVTPVGPFQLTDIVTVTVGSGAAGCGVDLGEFASSCPVTLTCGSTTTVNYCYKNNDSKSWTFISPTPGETVTLTFVSGTIDENTDIVRIYDGLDNSGTLLATSTVSSMAGLTATSTGQELYMEVDSDPAGSCQDGAQTSWMFEVECTPGCVDPDGSVVVTTDCPNYNFTIDVEVLFVGDAPNGTTSISYTVNGGAPTVIPGLVDFDVQNLGTFAIDDVVAIQLLHESDALCNRNLGTFTDNNTCGLPSESCLSAQNLASLTSPYSSTTVGYVDDLSSYPGGCQNNTSPDRIFYIDVPNGSQLIIGQTVNGYDSENYVGYGGACPGATQIACYDDSDIQNITWTNTTGSTQRVYWVQDGYFDASNVGTFTLAWSVSGCAAPSGVNTTLVTSTQAQVNFTGVTGNYIVEYGPAATFTTPGTGATAGVNGTIVTGTASPITITGLTNNTQYRYFVRRDCGVDGYSANAGPVLFTTLALPPVNDECANAIPVSCAGSPYAGTNVAATGEGLPSQASGGETTVDNGVWYVYTGDDSQVTASLCGSGFDTRIHVFSGDCLTPVGVAGNDDFCGTQSQVTFSAYSGTTYYIIVEGYFTASGSFTLALSCSALCLPVPGNDACSNAAVVTPGAFGTCVTTTGSMGCAASTPGNPSCLSTFGTFSDVFYSFTAPSATANVRVSNVTSTLSGWAVYDACGGSQITCSTIFGSDVTLSGLTSGSSYVIRVLSTQLDAGTFTVCVSDGPQPPANDLCANAIAVGCNSVTTGTTVLSSTTGAPGDCGTNLNTAGGVWYTMAGWDGPMTASLCGSGFDTKIGVFTGSCGAFTCVTGVDDFCGLQSQVSWTGSNGTTYYIYVTGFSANTGAFTLTTQCGDNNALCTENGLTLEFQTDAAPFETTWEIRNEAGTVVATSGGPLVAPFGVQTESGCVPDGCYTLRVLDAAGDGMTTGGYILRTQGTNQRIIDNRNNFNTGSVSAISGGQGFCLPLSNDKVIFSSCDKLDWINGQYVVASPNAAVSAEWVVNGANSVQDNNSGYEFWIFDPNGSYSFRRFRSHNVSDGFGPASATRACHMKLNNWALASQVPALDLMNVRVRARVNGVNGEFGPACRLMIDPVRAACPLTNLMDVPGSSQFSCNVIRQYGTNNYVYARPVSGANRYQFRFRLPAEGFEVVRQTTSYTLQLNWTGPTALQDGKTYEVDVRVSKDAGATWCTASDPWGNICSVTIDQTPAGSGNQNFAAQGAAAELRMFPNPNRGDVLNFSLSAIEEGVNTVSVDIFDLFGKRVSARTIAVTHGNVNTTLDLNGDLAAGMYLVNITAGETVYTERLVIQP